MMRTSTILLVGCLMLAGCGSEEFSDLRAFVKESDNLPHGRIPPLPVAKPYEPFSYEAFDLVDPFKPRKIESPKGVAGAGGLQPDFNRRKEPLEAYPLESLAMVGTLQQRKNMYAIIKTPDSNLFRVRAGNYLGQNFGRITDISDSLITLKEIIQDSGGSWEERNQTLQLQDEQEKRK